MAPFSRQDSWRAIYYMASSARMGIHADSLLEMSRRRRSVHDCHADTRGGLRLSFWHDPASGDG